MLDPAVSPERTHAHLIGPGWLHVRCDWSRCDHLSYCEAQVGRWSQSSVTGRETTPRQLTGPVTGNVRPQGHAVNLVHSGPAIYHDWPCNPVTGPRQVPVVGPMCGHAPMIGPRLACPSVLQ
jgi:hypothetical protein